MSDSILAWHFSDGELRFDYAGVKVEAGLVLESQEKPIAEKKGFHASVRALDALRWYVVRPQTKFIISRVRLTGEIIEDKHRVIAQKREHLWVADAKAVLEMFVEQQKLYPSEIHILLVDLRLEIYKWIYPDYPDFDSLNDNQNLEKELIAIPLHPLGNQVLEYTDLIFQLEDELNRLRIWEKALLDGFDLTAYLKLNYDHYGVFHWLGDVDESISRKRIEQENYKRGRWWAIENPPQEYAKFFSVPKDPNERFHEMLMRLAPEEYEE